MIPREVIEAAEEIKRFEKNDNPDALKDFNLDETTNKVHIDHAQLANTMVKFICFVRMPNQSKEILLYKIANPGATNLQVAMAMGMRLIDVDLYEMEGIKRTEDALKSQSLQDSINKYNTERLVEAEVNNLKLKDIGGNKLS